MNKIDKKNWKEVYYGDYVDHIERNESNPEKRKNSKFVSVEHIETGKLRIESWADEEMPTFLRTFKPGDILFGKRRAYQRKVAVADFEGICSPHIWALRTKNELLQDLLPFIMLTDKFYEYANANSAGTMSVYLKWPQLSRYKFLLPPSEDQKQIAVLFQNLESTIADFTNQEMNLRTLRKSLIDNLKRKNPIFGNVIKSSSCRNYKIGDLSSEVTDRCENPQKSGLKKFIGLEEFESGELLVKKYTSTEDLVSAMKLCKKNDVLFARRNAYLKRCSCADFDAVCSGDVIVMRANKNIILPKYLTLVMNTSEFWEFAIANAAGTMSKRVKWRDLITYSFDLPQIEIQEIIIEVFDQLDSILIDLTNQKEILKNLKQKLLNEILG